MTIRKMNAEIIDVLPVNSVLASVFDKEGLAGLVQGLLDANPKTVFVSTGGTGAKIKEAIENYQDAFVMEFNNYVSVEELTGTPEMEGGLVKTLTPGIHARLLGERENPSHQEYLDEIKIPTKYLEFDSESCRVSQGQYPEVGFFDLVVTSLYPFEKVAAKFRAESSFEDVRGNIDIGGPAMIRAAAKNFPNIAVVTDSSQYGKVINEVKETGGICFNTRADLASQAFAATAEYDAAISEFFFRTVQIDAKKDVRTCYEFKGGE